MLLRQNGSRNSASGPSAAETSSRRDTNRVLNALAILVCLGLYLYHFFVVWTYAVDIPFWDEWTLLDKGALSPQFDVSWIFARLNEHRIVTDKLLIWSLYHINGWDIASQQLFNFLLYGVLLLVVVKMARAIAPQMPLWTILAFAIFLLSPINHENHFMGFQSSFHFVVLFFLCATSLLFSTRNDASGATTQSWKSLLTGSLCAILSIYSLSSGVVSCAILLLLFGIWKINRARRSPVALRKREWQQLVLVTVAILGALLLWTATWRSTAGDIPRGTPFSLAFWTWFFNVLSAGFGFESYSVLFGLLCLTFVLAPLIWPLLRRQKITPAFWMSCAVAIGMLLVLMLTTLGRVNTGLDKSKTPRYVEFVLVLIPVAAAAWHQMLHQMPRGQKWRAPVLAALWMFCFFSFLNDWTYFGYYKDQYEERSAGAACVAKYYETGNPTGKDWRCRSIYPDVLNQQLERARELGVSFSRNRAH